MLITPAYAQDGNPLAMLGGAGQILPLVLIFAVFYFLLIRPQQQKAKEAKRMLSELKRGDRVVTGGGILGTVTKPPQRRGPRDRGGGRRQHPRHRAARDHQQRGQAAGRQ